MQFLMHGGHAFQRRDFEGVRSFLEKHAPEFRLGVGVSKGVRCVVKDEIAAFFHGSEELKDFRLHRFPQVGSVESEPRAGLIYGSCGLRPGDATRFGGGSHP
jgi:hypothetical protein